MGCYRHMGGGFRNVRGRLRISLPVRDSMPDRFTKRSRNPKLNITGAFSFSRRRAWEEPPLRRQTFVFGGSDKRCHVRRARRCPEWYGEAGL